MKSFLSVGKISESFKYLSPYIICEIGVNHEGDIKLAKKMIEQVARAGGHAAKFQTYKADKIASKKYSSSYWDLKKEPSTSQHALFSKYDSFGPKEYSELAKHCKKHHVDFLSTPFDLDAVDFLSASMPFFKIASADITNIPLLKKVASKKKPVLMLTGAAILTEIENAALTLKSSGASDIAIMHCVLNYPTPPAHAQLGYMNVLKRVFGDTHHIGYSDHVAPQEDGTMPALEIATLNGAVVLEKHFTFNKSLPGNDHYHAMDEKDLKAFTTKLQIYKTLYGDGKKNLSLETQAINRARRKILAAKKIKSGEKFTDKNLIALRADIGVEVAYWNEVVGKHASKNIAEGEPIEWISLK